MIIKEDIHTNPARQANFPEVVNARRQSSEAISVFKGTVTGFRGIYRDWKVTGEYQDNGSYGVKISLGISFIELQTKD